MHAKAFTRLTAPGQAYERCAVKVECMARKASRESSSSWSAREAGNSIQSLDDERAHTGNRMFVTFINARDVDSGRCSISLIAMPTIRQQSRGYSEETEKFLVSTLHHLLSSVGCDS